MHLSNPGPAVVPSTASRSGANGDATPAPARPAAPQVGAYYLNANMYTAVPSQVRADMEWMAAIGTTFLCTGVLEQDLWAAQENLEFIIDEATRVGIRVLAVPSRWAGLTAGAPKVPSIFSVLHPHTWAKNENGDTGFSPQTSGVVSSIHWPDTLGFFCTQLSELFRQHPRLAGLLIDEPKGFFEDHSQRAREQLGADAPRQAHLEAAAQFYSEVCAYAKSLRPDLLTLLFMPSHDPDDQLAVCAGMKHLDYFGADGRPWDLGTDQRWENSASSQESGKGKVLLSGLGRKFIDAAKANGKKSVLLVENHNLSADMIEPMDRHYGEVLALNADLYLYYYYPRNVQDPDRAMEVVARHIKRLASGVRAGK